MQNLAEADDQKSKKSDKHSEHHSYAQIVKASALIGGASVVNILLGIVRTKALAILLGPVGVGLMGLYSSVADLAQSVAGMGINNAGIRQIAAAVGSGEQECVARTAIVLRRTAFLCGFFGAVLLVAASHSVSKVTFGDENHSAAIAILSISVFFTSIAGGQGALIQGMRRIKDFACISVIGTTLGVGIGILLIYLFRENGVVPSLVCSSAVMAAVTLSYSRKIPIAWAQISFHDTRNEAAALLKLGLAFMASGLITMGSAYLIRAMVVHSSGIRMAGLYQSAWTLGGLYVGFILQAMGTDFYPRLTAIAKDNRECNRVVNQQAEISLLLAGPGVLATLTLAPLALALFYSAEFAAAAASLRWICLGLTLRVVAWPMGFILLAKGVQTLFFVTELAAGVVHVGLAWMFLRWYGLTGAGAAFFGLYVWHSVLIYAVVRSLTGFRWSAANRKQGCAVLLAVALVFGGFFALPFWLATAAGIVLTLALTAYSVRRLAVLLPGDHIPRPIRQIIVALRLHPAS